MFEIFRRLQKENKIFKILVFVKASLWERPLCLSTYCARPFKFYERCFIKFDYIVDFEKSLLCISGIFTVWYLQLSKVLVKRKDTFEHWPWGSLEPDHLIGGS